MPRPAGSLKASRRSLIAGGLASLALPMAAPRRAAAAEDKTLRIFNWDNYMGSTTFADFKAATGIEVTQDIYSDDDEILAWIKKGTPQYDVVVPSSDVLERLIAASQVQPLDHAKFPNLANIDKSLLDAAFDRGRRYAIPYTWGTIGMGYSKTAFPDQPTSWKLLYDSDQIAGKFTLMDDPYNGIGCGLKYLGFSYNSADPDELKQVEELLIKQKKNVRSFEPTQGQELLAAGDTVACQEWNGDIAEIMTRNAAISYVIPDEGSMIWQDVMAIPTGAPHPENAHLFLNFVLDAKVGKNIAETIQYATPNAAARALMDDSYVNNPAIFPPGEVIAKCEPGLYLGEEADQLRQDIWARVKAA